VAQVRIDDDPVALLAVIEKARQHGVGGIAKQISQHRPKILPRKPEWIGCLPRLYS
jgi:hypothetical protein